MAGNGRHCCRICGQNRDDQHVYNNITFVRCTRVCNGQRAAYRRRQEKPDPSPTTPRGGTSKIRAIIIHKRWRRDIHMSGGNGRTRSRRHGGGTVTAGKCRHQRIKYSRLRTNHTHVYISVILI